MIVHGGCTVLPPVQSWDIKQMIWIIICYMSQLMTYNRWLFSTPDLWLVRQRSGVPARSLRSSSDTNVLVVPRSRTKRSTSAFGSAAPSTWNGLPKSVRDLDFAEIFKKQLKMCLFSLSGDVLVRHWQLFVFSHGELLSCISHSITSVSSFWSRLSICIPENNGADILLLLLLLLHDCFYNFSLLISVYTNT